jgi:hypothetical protein
MSEQVIKNHLRHVFDKLGVWSRLELAVYAAEHGGRNWPQANSVEAVSSHNFGLFMVGDYSFCRNS